MDAMKVILFLTLVTLITVKSELTDDVNINDDVTKHDDVRSDDFGVLTLVQQQAATISQFQAKLTAMETTMQSQSQRIHQLEQTLRETQAKIPTVTSVQTRLDDLQVSTDALTFYLAYKLTTEIGARKVFEQMPHARQVLQQVFPVKLENGGNVTEGRVSIKIGNSWGTSCDDVITDTFAKVICNQLEYPSNHATYIPEAKFGQGAGLIFLDDVRCGGNESHVLLCPAQPLVEGMTSCRHEEDVGVLCLPYVTSESEGASVCVI